MTEEQKQKAIVALRHGLETIQAREYREIAEIPSEDQDYFEVKYSFVHDGLEGIFTIVGKGTDQLILQAGYEKDRSPYPPAIIEQIDRDLDSAQTYLNDQLQIG